jgi:hypothetical protein
MFSLKDINVIIVSDVLNINFLNIVYIYKYLMDSVLYDIFYTNIFILSSICNHEHNLMPHVSQSFTQLRGYG